MAPLTHRHTSQPVWWGFGAGLAFAAWFGQPLLTGGLEHNFFGVFWYSMIGLAAAVWAFPAVHQLHAGEVTRSYALLGLLVVHTQRYPLSQFVAVRLEQDPNVLGRDSIWVMLVDAEGQSPFAFARLRASHANVARAQQLAQSLAQATGLPLEAVEDGDEGQV